MHGQAMTGQRGSAVCPHCSALSSPSSSARMLHTKSSPDSGAGRVPSTASDVQMGTQGQQVPDHRVLRGFQEFCPWSPAPPPLQGAKAYSQRHL